MVTSDRCSGLPSIVSRMNVDLIGQDMLGCPLTQVTGERRFFFDLTRSMPSPTSSLRTANEPSPCTRPRWEIRRLFLAPFVPARNAERAVLPKFFSVPASNLAAVVEVEVFAVHPKMKRLHQWDRVEKEFALVPILH